MAVYDLTAIFAPQYVSHTAAAVPFAYGSWGTVIPAGFKLQIQVARVANNGAVPVSLTVWRVPSGSSADNAHVVCGSLNIPISTNTYPQFDLTALWGVVLSPGDTIWAIAGTASALVIQADGIIEQA